MSTPSAERLSIELERLAMRALRDEYSRLNWFLFENSLRQPVLRFVDSQSRLGRWNSTERTLEICRSLLSDSTWGVLVEVLKHEMAHQYTDEVLGSSAEGPHGPAFRSVCRERGIDSRAAGLPITGEGSDTDARIVERIAKLLSLARGTDHHEAELAMATAERLMLKYNVDLAAHGGSAVHGFRHLGEPTGRVSQSRRLLASILRDYFFVEVVWVGVWRPLAGKRGSILEVCGTPENVQTAAYVHSFLDHEAEQLWRAFKRERGIKSNAARRTFMAGVMSGFRDKLEAERNQQREQGIVWVGDPEVTRYFRQRHPRLRMIRHAARRVQSEFHDGRAAGQRIVFRRGVDDGAREAVRLLPPSARASSDVAKPATAQEKG